MIQWIIELIRLEICVILWICWTRAFVNINLDANKIQFFICDIIMELINHQRIISHILFLFVTSTTNPSPFDFDWTYYRHYHNNRVTSIFFALLKPSLAYHLRTYFFFFILLKVSFPAILFILSRKLCEIVVRVVCRFFMAV